MGNDAPPQNIQPVRWNSSPDLPELQLVSTLPLNNTETGSATWGVFSVPKADCLNHSPGQTGGPYTCGDLHTKGSSAAVPDLAVQGDCVRGASPEAWDFHGAQAARDGETVNFSGLAGLLDLNDKLIIDPFGGGPVQSERVPANLGHREVSQVWNLFCIGT